MSLHTPIPVQIDGFWACPANKESLQLLCQDFLKEIAKGKKKEIILSGSVRSDYVDIDCIKCQEDGQFLKQNILTSKIEETETRIIPHIHQVAMKSFNRLVFKSNDRGICSPTILYRPF